MTALPSTSEKDSEAYDAIVVGAGFGGLYMLHRLRELGLRAHLIERGSGVGGTWYWNRYPGARCDVESVEYSYSFSEELQQEWEWTERFASQPEILRYLEHAAERFNLYPDIEFNTSVVAAHFDEIANHWQVQTDKGAYTAKYCVMATGCLSSTNIPDFPGLESFQGTTYHTGSWPHEDVDFSGQRVGIIGTGSSSIQATPVIAEQAEHLYVFQRTPNFSVPQGNAQLAPEKQAAIKADYKGFRATQRALGFACHHPPRQQSALEATPAERTEIYEQWWQKGGLSFLGSFNDLITNAESNATAAEFIRQKIRDIVTDPEVAEKLCPDHYVGCKRPCADNGYYEAFNRDNVTLVDVKAAPIETFTTDGLKTTAASFKLDSVVFATGFDAMTGTLDNIDIRGIDGLSLKDKWHAGPRTYLGIATTGFPNFFIITGPGSPSVLASMTVGVEHHAEWISECIDYLEQRDLARIEATLAAEDAWVKHVNEVADMTLFPTCNSWYLGANIPGKPRIFMPYIGGFPVYEAKCREVAEQGYEGFKFA